MLAFKLSLCCAQFIMVLFNVVNLTDGYRRSQRLLSNSSTFVYKKRSETRKFFLGAGGCHVPPELLRLGIVEYGS
jgi:hypothetical protein